MAEYIEREATIKELLAVYEREFPTASGAFDEFATKILPNVITSIPAADVAPVRRGKWVPSESPFMAECANCSECGCKIVIGLNWNYCPNCGAKMEENYE